MAKRKTVLKAHLNFIPCTPRSLPESELHAAALSAIAHNPANRPAGSHPPQRIGVLTQKYWGPKGVDLAVAFMETTNQILADRIIGHMNAWQTEAGANVKFRYTAQKGSAQVRISRGSGGYWSYLGTDITHVPMGEQTMNLQGFVMSTPESEYKRVVRHETGHTLGFPHEHTRQDIVSLLDVSRTLAYFKRTQGWSDQEIRDQVLTAIEESSLIDPTRADGVSIMCYQLPGSITKSGQPIPGGLDLDDLDKQYAVKMYPLSTQPPPPPPPTSGVWSFTIGVTVDKVTGKVVLSQAT